MRLTFGMYLDGTAWSDKEASVGELQLGPAGLLGLLETELGLTGPKVHPARRINQYLRRLEARDGADKWFHASFQADKWSTAKQMLAWRDELIEAGWEGRADPDSSPRLRALAELERVEPPLAPGRGDRLRNVLRHIEQAPPLPEADIHLLEPLDMLPAAWRNLLDRLSEKGAGIGNAARSTHQAGSTNLSAVRSGKTGGQLGLPSPADNDSLLLVRAGDEWEAADHLARWLAAAPAAANEEVTIICGADTDVLDPALQRHGLPQLGRSGQSPWRAALQILPLVLANAWLPVDITRLVELLSLPLSPVPRDAARRLLGALRQEPGVGGDAWKKALARIAADYEVKADKKGAMGAKKKAAEFIAMLDGFLAADRYLPGEGIPEEQLKRRCQWVVDCVAWRIGGEPMMAEVVGHAREMQKLADGKGRIPRTTIERMLDSIIGPGAVAPDRLEQAAPWRVVDHPGQITTDVGTVVWWGFTESATSSPAYWSRAERASLLKAGVELEDSAAFRAREALAWRQALDRAHDNLLLFSPAQMHGEPAYHHPLWDEIRATAIQTWPDHPEAALQEALTRDCFDLHRGAEWRLAGRSAQNQEAEKLPPAAVIAAHAIPENTAAARAPLSFSQMQTMLGCPMKWVLDYHTGLKIADTLAVPTGNQMIGTFCHRIIQELYAEPGETRTPEAAERRALELYDSLVGSMASELLLPGNEVENKRYRAAVGGAVKQLAAALERYGLSVEKSEARLEGDLDGTPFIGFADMLLRDRRGHPFVLDLKWSHASRYRKDEVKEGALQLATYAWLARGSDAGNWPHSGYFMLAQGEFVSGSPLLEDEAVEAQYSLEQVWAMGVKHWEVRLAALNDGRCEAGGVREALAAAETGSAKEKIRAEFKDRNQSEGLLYQSPSCGFCNFTALCGLTGGAL